MGLPGFSSVGLRLCIRSDGYLPAHPHVSQITSQRDYEALTRAAMGVQVVGAATIAKHPCWVQGFSFGDSCFVVTFLLALSQLICQASMLGSGFQLWGPFIL